MLPNMKNPLRHLRINFFRSQFFLFARSFFFFFFWWFFTAANALTRLFWGLRLFRILSIMLSHGLVYVHSDAVLNLCHFRVKAFILLPFWQIILCIIWWRIFIHVFHYFARHQCSSLFCHNVLQSLLFLSIILIYFGPLHHNIQLLINLLLFPWLHLQNKKF